MFQKTKATTKTWFAKVIASFFHRTSATCNRACNTDITSLFLFLCLIEIHSARLNSLYETWSSKCIKISKCKTEYEYQNARLNSLYETWSCKKQNHKKTKAYKNLFRKNLYTVKRSI